MKNRMPKVLIFTLIAFLISGCKSKEQNSDGEKIDSMDENIVIPEGYVEELDDMIFDEGEFDSLYNYAPSVMVDGHEAHIYYCSSWISGKAGADDRIAYRHGIKKDGKWYWGPKIMALDKGLEGEWDSMDVCDPDVVKGEFKYNNEKYNYLMTYLGCITPGNYENSYGFAVSKEPSGPWIRVESLSPLYDFYDLHPDYEYKGYDDPATSIWGCGQSCLVSKDKKGQVFVFDTGRSSTGQTCELWDFSDLNNPTMLWRQEVSNYGIKDLNGNTDTICNAQFMYDARLKCFYMLSDVHPFDESVAPANLPSETRITMINDFDSEEIGDCFKDNKAFWTTLGGLSFDTTGYVKNSNTCFERDCYGWMIQNNHFDILYSNMPNGTSSMFGFRIRRYVFKF